MNPKSRIAPSPVSGRSEAFNVDVPRRARRSAEEAELADAVLRVVLEALPGSVFLLSGNGAVVRTNAAGHTSLTADEDRTLRSLQSLKVGRTGHFQVTAITATSGASFRLIIESPPSQKAGSRVRKASDLWCLTPREAEVLVLLAQGLPSKSIAKQLGCTPRTVAAHVAQILVKSGCPNRATVLAVLSSGRFDAAPGDTRRVRRSEGH